MATTQEEIKQAALAKPNQTNAYTNLAGVSQGTKDNLNYYGQGYQQSQTVTDAKNYLQSVIDNKPGEFQSQYDQQISTLYEQIMGRKPFTYDVNKDQLYQQYKNQYQLLGNQAMQDTIGNAAALTGGYGNSWATTAGSQAYQGYLQQLNNMIPELYSQAYARYAQEGQDMKDMLGIAQSLRNTEYGEYRDTVSDWQADRSYAASQYDAEYARDYDNWMNMLSFYQNLAGQENSSYWNSQNNALAWAQFEFEKQKYADSQKNSGGGGTKTTTDKQQTNNTSSNLESGFVNPLAEYSVPLSARVAQQNSGTTLKGMPAPGSTEYTTLMRDIEKEFEKLSKTK